MFPCDLYTVWQRRKSISYCEYVYEEREVEAMALNNSNTIKKNATVPSYDPHSTRSTERICFLSRRTHRAKIDENCIVYLVQYCCTLRVYNNIYFLFVKNEKVCRLCLEMLSAVKWLHLSKNLFKYTWAHGHMGSPMWGCWFNPNCF